MLPKTYSLAEVAEVLHLSTTQVSTLVRAGKLEAVNVSAGSKRARFVFTEEQVREFLERQTFRPPEKIVAMKPYKRRWN
ncbi:MAG: helix-turn-helix domain-containing protein [Planctomycetota bacterium]